MNQMRKPIKWQQLLKPAIAVLAPLLAWQLVTTSPSNAPEILAVGTTVSIYLVLVRLMGLRNRLIYSNKIVVAMAAVLVSSTALLPVSVGGAFLERHETRMANQVDSSDSETAGYAIFNPEAVGEDAESIRSGGMGPVLAEADGLYEALESSGAEYIDATEYETGNLATPAPVGYVRSMTVNTNWLSSNRLVGPDGNAVTVDADETDWVVLAPSKYRDSERQIREFFARARNGDSGYEGARQAQARYYGTDLKAQQNVEIRWIRDDQEIPSGNPEVFPNYGHMVRNPILQVITRKNSLPFDRFNSITGTAGSALKVPLAGASPEEVLQGLQPLLKKLELDDNLTKMMPAAIMGEPTSVEQRADIVGIESVPTMVIVALLLFFSIGSAGRLIYFVDRDFFVKVLVVAISVLVMSTAILAGAGLNPEPWEVVLPLLIGCAALALLSFSRSTPTGAR